MATIAKHRDERRLFGIDFAAELGAATIATIDLVEIWKDGAEFTEEFRGVVPEAPVISGTRVDFWLEPAAAADEQAVGVYTVKVRITSSDDEEPVALDDFRLIRLVVVGD